MLDKQQRQAIFNRGKPETLWEGEPLLGSIYGEEEIDAAVGAIRRAMDFSKGFGFSSAPIVEFEQAFAAYCDSKHAVAVNSAGPGLDMMMRYLDLQPGDEVIVPAINFVAAVRGERAPLCEAAEALEDLRVARAYIGLLTGM